MKRMIPLIWTLGSLGLLLPAGFLLAEIKNPYIIDEKPQVIFGDSAQITATSTEGQVVTYQGLENYAHDYVNHYLHLTFTYTHAGVDLFCCYASYPPKIYVTAANPVSTSTPTVRSTAIIYPLMPRPIPPGHETDWYLYDVQFDATGYMVSVLQGGATSTASFHENVPGLTSTDYVALANDYPLGGSFDGSTTTNSMSFTPLLVNDTPTPLAPVATTTPVIIVPGIMGSYLNKNDGSNDEVWMNLLKMALPGSDSYLNELGLSADGTSPVSLSAIDIIRKINIPLFSRDMFNGLIENTEASNYIENEDLFVFPYDWRFDLTNTASNLKNKIEEIKIARGVDKVDLVAHSMGGLLVKEYLRNYGGDSIEKFVDIGTPHNGASKSFLTLLYGNTDIGILNKETIKTISQNMSSLYQLLPSQNYFTSDEYYVFDGTSGTKRLNFSETKNFLKGQGRNAALVDRADAFHQEIDGLDPATYGVDTYNIVGCGTPTIGKFYVLQTGDHPIYNIGYVNGDGTVPLTSAEALPAGKTYYLKDAKHALMPSTTGVEELVAHILTHASSSTFDIAGYANLATSASGCSLPNGRIVSLHSPIDLHIYDSSGNHVGPDMNGDIESGIPNVTYDVIDGNKFAFLPDGVDYTVKGSATGAGTFDLRIQEVVGGVVSTTTLFADVPLTSSTQLAFSINSNTPTEIALDNNADGIYESVKNVSISTQGILEATGKTPPAIITPAKLASAKSGGNAKVPPSAAASSTLFKTDSKVLPPPFATTSFPVPKSPKVIRSSSTPQSAAVTETKATTSPNTALVYKSVPAKLGSVLRGMWGWIKSKL